MEDAIISLDLDFLQSPLYHRNNYGNNTYNSDSNYMPYIKRWITTEEVINKLPEKTHGSFSGDNSGSIGCLLRIQSLKRVDKPVFINIDQHHNMYWHKESSSTELYSLSSFKPYECNINLFKNDLISRFIWVVPDYFDEQCLISNLLFQQEITREGNTIRFHFLDIDIEFEYIKWSDFKVSDYSIKFLNIVRNTNFTNIQSEELDAFSKIISIW